MKKRQLFIAVLMLALLLCGCQSNAAPAPTTAPTAIAAPTPTPSAAPATPTPEPTPSEKPVSPEVQAMLDENKDVWREMHNRAYMEGRLLIPSAGIDVALFNEGENKENKSTEVLRQDIVDLEDSALLYYDDPVGNIIADHSNQDFAKLPEVKVGDAAYILSGDRMVTLECVFTTDGVNTGYGITDMDGGWHHDDVDYVCYTCLEDWTHIQMVGFAMKDEDFIDIDWIDVGEANNNAGSTAGSATTTSTSANNGVATTISLPAPAPANTNTESGNAAAATPAPAASPAPATPTPTAAPAAPQPVQQAPVYDDYTIPGYDIYADADSTFGIYYSNGVDSYLG